MMRQEPRGAQPVLEAQYGCGDPNQSPCAIVSASDIDLALNISPDTLPRDGDGHGTHITSIAAGNGGVMNQIFPVFVGVAPEATIITAAPSSGRGFADPDILRAVRFIFDRADAMGMPAVVNVSLGSDFGPHDGSSELEAGLAALVGPDKPGHVIVVAAGNSGALYASSDPDLGPFGIHTEAHVSPNAVTRVPIVQPDAEEALTILGSDKIDGAGFVWITFRPGDDVSVGLEGPNGISIGLTGPGSEKGDNKGSVVAAVVNNLVNGKTSLNADTNSAVVFWDGQWSPEDFTVLLSGRGDAQLWVTGTGGAGQGLSAGLQFARGLKSGTISVPASHPDLLSVGCTINRIIWTPLGVGAQLKLSEFGSQAPPIEDSICYFSGSGPSATGAMKPELLAPGAFIAAAMSRDADPRIDMTSMFYQPFCGDGLATCMLVDEYHAITSGTSMSSPHVAGAVALLLERDPTLTQREAIDILQAGARHPFGEVPFDFQQGPGELDMVGALQVLDDALDAEPAFVPASYYVLASPYVRPDPSWAVEGTIQLRHQDGSIVTNASVTDIRLVVDGGLVVRALERVRAGLFRFAISAPRGSGGTKLRFDVLYRGESLGARTLPVGVDAFAAGGGVDVVGGCVVSAPRRDADPWWLLPIAALGLRRPERRLTRKG
jgi:subtilisin family serine protease